MIIVEISLGVALLVLCVLNSVSDCKNGLIYNKTLLWFAGIGVVLDGVYYGFFVRDIGVEFLTNLLVVSVICIVLFYTHSFAGGDCKFFIVASLLYPARFYIVYNSSNITLIAAVCFSILWGYLYLIGSSITGLISKKNVLSHGYIKSYLAGFAVSYFSATMYIGVIMLIAFWWQQSVFPLSAWIVRVLALTMAWCVGRFRFLRKWYAVTGAGILLVVLSVVFGTVPFSANFESYLFALALMICQMIIRNNVYVEVPISNLKCGMILSTMSSMMMQGSRVRGLPPLSKEDLRDRLTQEQVDSIVRWARSRQVESLAVVKKIPFAVFISVGFISYFIVWSVFCCEHLPA